MKNVTRIALIAVMTGISTTGYGLSVSMSKAECKQKLNQMQQIQCGNISAPLTLNVSGGGNVYFGPTTCNISAIMTAQQIAYCTAIAGKAGDILTFAASELPQTVGVNKFDLGKIVGKKDVAGINAPQDGSGVLFSFVTDAGLPINFLLKRQTFTSADLEALSTETPAAAQYKEKLKAQLASAGGKGILTIYYRQIPGMETTWTELWTDLDSPASYPFAPKFNARVYQNGLVVLNTNIGKDPQTKRLFFVGDYQLQPSDKALGVPKGTTPTQIPIGGGKFVTLKDV